MNDSALGLLLLVGLAGCAAEAPPRAEAAAPAVQPAEPAAAAGRQIIRRALLVVRVESFGEAERRLNELIGADGAYVAQFREDRSSGARRGGQWTIRVPVPRFAHFVEQAGLLGIAEQRETHTDDVTEEYVDLEARAKNKQALEARLLELVARRSDDIKDVLALEAELARVREEIERMQARLRQLRDRVALSTVDITAYERLDYRPPLATTFAGKISQTFWDSANELRKCGEACVLVIVGLLPWLAAISLALCVVLAPLVWWARRRNRRPVIVVAQAVA
ncbi:MAG TPA: DUF4349 domain-containing protein [Pirellulaceae bacterium]|nr:DUF4349 domain-containing protein [Pirellulaceae bacterium]